VVAVTAPPPALTVNESRRKKEDNMAVIFMGFILVSGAPPLGAATLFSGIKNC
jgi:hypothetical protein